MNSVMSFKIFHQAESLHTEIMFTVLALSMAGFMESMEKRFPMAVWFIRIHFCIVFTLEF